MSRTYGHTRHIGEDACKKYGSEFHLKHNRSRPYLKDRDRGEKKILPEMGRGTGISKTGKLVARNANRAHKKGMRQQSKRIIEGSLLQ